MAREVEELEGDEWDDDDHDFLADRAAAKDAEEEHDNESAVGADSLDFGGSSECSDREQKTGDDERDERFDYVACLTDVFRYLYRKVSDQRQLTQDLGCVNSASGRCTGTQPFDMKCKLIPWQKGSKR